MSDADSERARLAAQRQQHHDHILRDEGWSEATITAMRPATKQTLSKVGTVVSFCLAVPLILVMALVLACLSPWFCPDDDNY